MSKLIAALRQLDPSNDSHWTSDGLPRLETIRLFAGDAQIARDAVTAAAPGFSRANRALPADAALSQGTASPAPIAAPAAAQPPASQQPPAAEVRPDVTQTLERGDAGADDETEQTAPVVENPLQAAKARVEQTGAAKAKADKEHQEAIAELDAQIDAAHRSGAQETLAQQIGAYHKQQLAALQRRGEQQQRLRAADIDLKALLPQRSNLDQSLARRNGRGTQRPRVPLK